MFMLTFPTQILVRICPKIINDQLRTHQLCLLVKINLPGKLPGTHYNQPMETLYNHDYYDQLGELRKRHLESQYNRTWCDYNLARTWCDFYFHFHFRYTAFVSASLHFACTFRVPV